MAGAFVPNSNWEAFLNKRKGKNPVDKPSEGMEKGNKPVSRTEASRRPLYHKDKVKASKYVAIDCEMVQVQDKSSALARVSIVDYFGNLLYDSLVRPQEAITDYRTEFTGLTPQDNLHHVGTPFPKALKMINSLLTDKIIIGHGLRNDFKVMFMTYPRASIRDTSKYKPFRTKYSNGKTPSLKKLTWEILGKRIQEGIHDPIEDARCAMFIYHSVQKTWERDLLRKNRRKGD